MVKIMSSGSLNMFWHKPNNNGGIPPTEELEEEKPR